MADTHCELCDSRFTPEERVERVTVHIQGGVGYAHPACQELNNRVYALVLCLEEWVKQSVIAQEDGSIESELNRMNRSDELRTHIFRVLK